MLRYRPLLLTFQQTYRSHPTPMRLMSRLLPRGGPAICWAASGLRRMKRTNSTDSSGYRLTSSTSPNDRTVDESVCTGGVLCYQISGSLMLQGLGFAIPNRAYGGLRRVLSERDYQPHGYLTCSPLNRFSNGSNGLGCHDAIDPGLSSVDNSTAAPIS